jgi:predicted nucleic acid-binding protein
VRRCCQAPAPAGANTGEPRLRDAADERVLDTLLAALNASQSDYLITGDKDLLAVADRYPILTPAQFWSLHGGP